MSQTHSAEQDKQQATIEALAAHLDKLEHKIDSLQQPSTAPKASAAKSDAEKQTESEEKSSSKVLTAGAIGLVGAKLGGLMGAKVGAITSSMDVKALDFSEVRGFSYLKKKLMGSDTLKALETFVPGGAETTAKTLVNMKAFGLIGATLVAIPGVILGYKRGDRLNKATDLIAKPLDSIHRLTQSEADFVKEHPTHPRAKEKNGAWQDRIEGERSTKSKDASASR